MHQDVQLSPEALRQTAAEVVVAADAERRLLLEDQRKFELLLSDKNADPGTSFRLLCLWNWAASLCSS